MAKTKTQSKTKRPKKGNLRHFKTQLKHYISSS